MRHHPDYDDAACFARESEDCNAVIAARAVCVPCGCARFLCHEHWVYRMIDLAMVKQGLAQCVCPAHPAQTITPDDIHIYPI